MTQRPRGSRLDKSPSIHFGLGMPGTNKCSRTSVITLRLTFLQESRANLPEGHLAISFARRRLNEGVDALRVGDVLEHNLALVQRALAKPQLQQLEVADLANERLSQMNVNFQIRCGTLAHDWYH